MMVNYLICGIKVIKLERKLTKEEIEKLDIDELIKNLPEVKQTKSKLPYVIIALIIVTLLLMVLATVLSSK